MKKILTKKIHTVITSYTLQELADRLNELEMPTLLFSIKIQDSGKPEYYQNLVVHYLNETKNET